jgi:nitrous oxidase accessory protein NosD
MRYLTLFALNLLCLITLASPIVRLKKGMVIRSSVTISTSTYLINANSALTTPLLIIEGNNIIVDFNNAVLQGSNDKDKPNEFYGLAILIKAGSKNVSLKNANIHGYKVAVMADSVQNLTIENCNLSYNYRQQLHSNLFREDVSDWMSYHHNENDEWLRYGAAIYMKDCTKATVKNNFITGGQCGLMMMRCDSGEIFSNNISFNSGIGIGMYRSSNNNIYRNRLDFNVRGFSFGKYNRGQDSAGILVFEQCNNNTFAYNSATHSGDGFFLWAGQHTMDTGEGGCNDNLILGNDFSFAPTNGIEVTFSRNKIRENFIKGCDNGIWGGYSYGTLISLNAIRNNKVGVAIEHGLDNAIWGNNFRENNTAIKLWSRATQPSDWGYAKYRDTRSSNYQIEVNHFAKNGIVYNIMGTDSIDFKSNWQHDNQQIYKLGERLGKIDSSKEHGNQDAFSTVTLYRNYASTPNTKFPRGRDQMRLNEWGPYDFGYPLLWLSDVDSAGVYHFDILGPAGTKKIKTVSGFAILYSDSKKITARADSSKQDRKILMEYKGKGFTDQLGKKQAANKPYQYGYTEFDPRTMWDISWYKWNEETNPNKDFGKFVMSLTNPVLTARTSKVDYTWWGAIGKNLPADSFATVATTRLHVPAGEYELSVTADDLVKVFIEGKEVISAWDAKLVEYDEYTNHTIRLKLSGTENIKIVHVENSGLATLMFYLKPVRRM